MFKLKKMSFARGIACMLILLTLLIRGLAVKKERKTEYSVG